MNEVARRPSARSCGSSTVPVADLLDLFDARQHALARVHRLERLEVAVSRLFIGQRLLDSVGCRDAHPHRFGNVHAGVTMRDRRPKDMLRPSVLPALADHALALAHTTSGSRWVLVESEALGSVQPFGTHSQRCLILKTLAPRCSTSRPVCLAISARAVIAAFWTSARSLARAGALYEQLGPAGRTCPERSLVSRRQHFHIRSEDSPTP